MKKLARATTGNPDQMANPQGADGLRIPSAEDALKVPFVANAWSRFMEYPDDAAVVSEYFFAPLTAFAPAMLGIQTLNAKHFTRFADILFEQGHSGDAVEADKVLGSWVNSFRIRLPRMPAPVWRSLARLLENCEITEEDIRWIYRLTPAERYIAPAIEELKGMPAARRVIGQQFGVEAVLAIIRDMLEIAEFVGTFPPESVLQAVARLSGKSLPPRDDPSRFLAKRILADDPALRGTPWERKTVSAANWKLDARRLAILIEIMRSLKDDCPDGFLCEKDGDRVIHIEPQQKHFLSSPPTMVLRGASPLEAKIIEFIWSRESTTVDELKENVWKSKDITTKTVLNKMGEVAEILASNACQLEVRGGVYYFDKSLCPVG